MKCPHCGEELGLNDICINPMCSYFSTKIESNESSFSNTNSIPNDNNNSAHSNNYNNYRNVNNSYNNFNPNKLSKDEFAAFFDYKNDSYYLKYVDEYNSKNSFTSWNWPSFFLTLYWLLYRKLYAFAAGYFALNFLLSLFFSIPANLVLRIILAIFANYLYLRSAEGKIRQVKSTSTTISKEQYFMRLRQKGGTNLVAPIVIFVIILFLIIIFIIIAVLAFNLSPDVPSQYYY